MNIPPSLIGSVANIISNEYSHAQIDMLFLSAGFPDDIPDGSKPTKIMQWIRNANKLLEHPLTALGHALAEFMDQPEPAAETLNSDHWQNERWKEINAGICEITRVLNQEGLAYHRGGTITHGSNAGASKTLEEKLRDRPIQTVQEEFDRALENIDTNPRQAVDAACAILESVCKFYLTRTNIPMPKDQSISPLWNATAKGLGLDPARMEDNDLKKILSGLYSIAGGIGAFRTHAGGAHGRTEPEQGQKQYRVKPRHARLSVHSAHTLALFILETWDECNSNKP